MSKTAFRFSCILVRLNISILQFPRFAFLASSGCWFHCLLEKLFPKTFEDCAPISDSNLIEMKYVEQPTRILKFSAIREKLSPGALPRPWPIGRVGIGQSSRFQKIRLFGQIRFSVLDRLPFLTNLPVNHDGLSLGVMAQHPPWALLLRAFDVLKRHDATDGGCGRKRLKGPGFDPSRARGQTPNRPTSVVTEGRRRKKAHGAPPLAEGKGRSCYTPTSLESGGRFEGCPFLKASVKNTQFRQRKGNKNTV